MRRRRALAFGLMLILLFVVVYIFVQANVNPVLKTVSEEKVRALATLAVNEAAQNVMGENFVYDDIINVSADSEGNITLISINTALINTIARKTVTDSQQTITDMGEQGVGVPLGSLSGITIFAGKGPDVNIKVYPVGSVTSFFSSSFESAGINQTRHVIKMTVTASISVVIPGPNRTIVTNTDLILTESIIVGKIPEVYLQSSDISSMLDLIPGS